MASDERTKVIYILSLGHSGSTLLDLMLGSHSRIESVGELAHFRSFVSEDSDIPAERRFCTCGEPFIGCPYWARVREDLASTFGTDQISLSSADPRVFGERNAVALKSILDVSGKRIICDSSKTRSRLELLIASRRFDVHVVHLVRDSRAVAFSYIRKGQNPYKIAAFWQKTNVYQRIRYGRMRNLGSYVVMRYEDLVQNPRGEIARALAPLRLEFEDGQLEFWRETHHNVSGNRMRRKEKQNIRLDAEYLRQLDQRAWMGCTALSLLGLKFFGYDARRGAAGD